MPQNPNDWQELVWSRNDRPPEEDPSDPNVQRAFKAYVMRLGPLNTPDLRRVSSAIDAAHLQNDNSTVGPQRCVVVDGEPDAGKTYNSLAVAFRETRTIWSQKAPDDSPGHRSIPWVYIEVAAGARGLSIMSEVSRYLGIPEGTRSNTSAAAARIRTVAPLVGLRGIIIDDSHGIAGGSGARKEGAMLANTLKGAVTGLPATVVIVGAGLTHSGVLDNLFGRQIKQRAEWVHVGDWAPPVHGSINGPWTQLLALFNKARVLPDPARKIGLNSHKVLSYLATESNCCPGTAIKWLKRAACFAIDEGTDLDRAALEATHQ